MTLLITGASGFLGSNLLAHMAAAHPDATIVAADLALPIQEAAQVEYVALDVRDGEACNRLMLRTQPTHVLHAAAVTEGPSDLIFAVNRDGTANILEAARRAGSVIRGVLLSSSAVYDQSGEASCCEEDDALDLGAPYARAKREAELLLARESSFVAARIAPVYGQYEQQTAARPRVSLVQRLLEAWRQQREITVAGDMHRDWTHASDVACALDALLMTATLRSSIYNVSAGVSISARSIVSIFANHGLRVRCIEDAAQAEVVLDASASRRPLCCARLRSDTAYAPHFDIETGIASLIHAHERHS